MSCFCSATAPPRFVRAAAAGAYAIIVAGALLRRVSHRLRVWAVLIAMYMIASVGIVALPQGPYVRALPVFVPMVTIGLIGIRAARIATLVSTGVIMLAPFLRSAPPVVRILGIDPAQTTAPPGLTWLPGAGLTAAMIGIMVLLERLYAFLQQALDAQRLAAAAQSAVNRRLEGEILERRQLEREITRIGDEERRSLGREIHDGVCQQLTGALLRCQALESRMEHGAQVSAADMAALSTLLGETIDEARGVAQGLCPLEPAPEALAPALRALAKRTEDACGLPCEFHSEGDVRVPDTTTAWHLYRIAQEAVSNAVRHAHAGRIAVELRGDEEGLTLKVEDNGVGMQDSVPGTGMGLHTMAHRARAIDGRIAIEPAREGGICVLCVVPHPAGSRAEGQIQLRAGGSKK